MSGTRRVQNTKYVNTRRFLILKTASIYTRHSSTNVIKEIHVYEQVNVKEHIY